MCSRYYIDDDTLDEVHYEGNTQIAIPEQWIYWKTVVRK